MLPKLHILNSALDPERAMDVLNPRASLEPFLDSALSPPPLGYHGVDCRSELIDGLPKEPVIFPEPARRPITHVPGHASMEDTLDLVGVVEWKVIPRTISMLYF